jgi:lipopolysaccharide biosynthesis regulator YciM
MAVATLQEGKAKAAIVILRRLVREAPEFVPAWLRLGEAHAEAGGEDEAVETWNRGFEATWSPVLLSALEDFHLERERPLEAIAALKRCAARSSRDLLPRFYLGKLYFRLEMLDEAWNVLSELRNRASYAPSLHYLIGSIAERRGEHATATEAFRRALGESRLLDVGFRCQECAVASDGWRDRCPECGAWNSVEADLREVVSPEELGLSTAPVYTAEG